MLFLPSSHDAIVERSMDIYYYYYYYYGACFI